MNNDYCPENELKITADGSHTIFSKKFNCSFHSINGAIQESRHIFIENGLDYFAKKTDYHTISVLEYGFGTGLNAILSYLYCVDHKINLVYDSIEAFPLDADTIQQLNYAQVLGIDESWILHLHKGKFPKQIGEAFKLNLHIKKFEDFIIDQKFDIIFFDAFGPDDQPYLWERPFLDSIAEMTHSNSILLTYSVKGSFKRALKSLGFSVEKLPGPPGKREILRATKI